MASVSSEEGLGVDFSLTVGPLGVDVGPSGVECEGCIFSPGVLMGAPGVIDAVVGVGPPGVEPGPASEAPAERLMRLVLSASGTRTSIMSVIILPLV